MMAASLMANFSIAICVSYGQYAVPILGLISASVWLVSRGRDTAAGLLLGVAMVKPQLVLLLLLTLLLSGHIRLIVASVFVVVTSTIIAMAVLHSGLAQLLVNSGNEAALYYRLSHNPLLPLLTDQLGFRGAVAVLGLLGLAAVLLGTWRLGAAASPLRLASLACIVTMVWTYRKHYDVALMSIPLLELWCLTLASPRSSGRWGITLLVGLTLWLPLRDQQWSNLFVGWGQLAIWLAAGLWLVLAPAGRSEILPRDVQPGRA